MAIAKALPYGLKVHPRDALEALKLLAQYVEERRKVVEDKKITDVPNAVKMMDTINVFAETVGKLVKSPAELLYNNMRFTVVPELMDAEDITNIGVEGVGKVHLQDDISCKVEDKEKLHDWLTANGLEDLIVEQVNAQTLTASMRQRMKANAEKAKELFGDGDEVDPTLLLAMPPQELVKITPVVRAVITRK
jgi:hypothetical protein